MSHWSTSTCGVPQGSLLTTLHVMPISIGILFEDNTIIVGIAVSARN